MSFSTDINTQQRDYVALLFSDFRKVTGQAMIDLVKEEGALTCREAIKWNAPLDGKNGGGGDKKIAETWGDKAVELDVKSVALPANASLQATVNSSLANYRLFSDWKRGARPMGGIIGKIWDDNNTKRAYQMAKNLYANNPAEVLDSSGLMAIHNKQRAMYRGRIRRNGGPSDKNHQRVTSVAVMKDYIKKRQLRVGFMKSGWLAAIRKIGPPKINGIPKNYGVKDMPAWISRHAAIHGTAIFRGLEQGSRTSLDQSANLIVRNDLGNIFRSAERSATFLKVTMARAGKMEKRIAYYQRSNAFKFNSAQRNT